VKFWIWFLALFESRDKWTETNQHLINITVWKKQACRCDKKLSGTFNSVTEESRGSIPVTRLKIFYTVKNELFSKRIVIYYSRLVFLTLVPVLSTYHANNSEIPSIIKPGFFQPISGSLPVTQHLEETVTWLPGCQVTLKSVTFLIKEMTKKWCIATNCRCLSDPRSLSRGVRLFLAGFSFL